MRSRGTIRHRSWSSTTKTPAASVKPRRRAAPVSTCWKPRRAATPSRWPRVNGRISVVLDVNLPDISGLEVARRLSCPGVGSAGAADSANLQHRRHRRGSRARTEHGADVYLTGTRRERRAGGDGQRPASRAAGRNGVGSRASTGDAQSPVKSPSTRSRLKRRVHRDAVARASVTPLEPRSWAGSGSFRHTCSPRRRRAARARQPRTQRADAGAVD